MFNDRYDAAEKLLPYLQKYKDNTDVVIIAVPRGGLQLGVVLAKKLHAPLDVVFAKKIGAPTNPEFAIGGVSLDDVVVNPTYNVPQLQKYIAEQVEHIRAMLLQRKKLYKDSRPSISLKDKIVIVTDDGVATGTTMAVTLQLIKKQKPKKIIVAIPVAPPDAIQILSSVADEVICLEKPIAFFGVGAFYRNFEQVSDDQAAALLQSVGQ